MYINKEKRRNSKHYIDVGGNFPWQSDRCHSWTVNRRKELYILKCVYINIYNREREAGETHIRVDTNKTRGFHHLLCVTASNLFPSFRTSGHHHPRKRRLFRQQQIKGKTGGGRVESHKSGDAGRGIILRP